MSLLFFMFTLAKNRKILLALDSNNLSLQGEITTPSMKGPLGTLFSAMLCMGFLVSSLLAWLPWRIFSAMFTSVAVVIYGVMFFVPESPYYLAKRGLFIDVTVADTAIGHKVKNLEDFLF